MLDSNTTNILHIVLSMYEACVERNNVTSEAGNLSHYVLPGIPS